MTSERESTQVFTPEEAVLRSGHFTGEPARTMQTDGYPWEHEIRVALPRSYANSTRAYPVLWLTDNILEIALATIVEPLELILVSVGATRSGAGEIRRAYDFYAQDDLSRSGPIGDWVRELHIARGLPRPAGGGAARFLDFLV